ncbi:MAG: substrate-binding domain-containing protein [Kiritimatiellae bacterium]|nr:substrate-binding domain-containing protein [Kiritimatiellia bacterium]
MIFEKIIFSGKGSQSEQVRQWLRKRIGDGTIKPQDQLPPTHELASLLGTHVPAVHAAMRQLVREGMIVRGRGRGTFVRERPRALKTIGIYFFGGELSHPEYRYLRAVNRCLLDRVEALGMNWTVWNDPRPEKEHGEPWPALVDAIRHGDVDAVVSPIVDIPHIRWLRHLPTPVAFQCGLRIERPCVYADNSQMARLAVAALARQGCSSIGLISALPARRVDKYQTANHLALFRTFKDEVRRHGLSSDDAWIVTEDRFRNTPGMTSEEWGYRAFMQLWSQRERPEGLVVITDAESLGVTMAILEKGVRVPETLRLAYHKNAEVDLFCPLPVTYVVQKADDVAAALLDAVQREFAGEKVGPAVVEFTVQEAPEDDAAFGVVEAPAAMAGVQ